MKLRFPELAVGDGYKACRLIEVSRMQHSKYTHYVKLEIAIDLCGRDTSACRLPTELLSSSRGQDQIRSSLCEVEEKAILLLAEALYFANCFWEGLEVTREKSERLLDCKELVRLRKFIRAAYNDEEKEHQVDDCIMEDIMPLEREEQRRDGEIHVRPYPWMTADLLSRAPSVMADIKGNLKAASKSRCTLKSSNIREGMPLLDSYEKKIDVFGIFATTDLAQHQRVLVDRSCMCAVDNPTNCCSSCCEILPAESIRAKCCKAAFCSKSCLNRAMTFYHAAICGKSFPKYENAFQTGAVSAGRAADSQLLLRVLACAVSFPDLHPLNAPIINRMTSLYERSAVRRFSLATDIVLPLEILEQLGIDIYANHDYDTWVLQTILTRIRNNIRVCFTPEKTHVAINPLFTFFNHSCQPNVTYERDGTNWSSTLRLKTKCDIKAEDELFLSYISKEDLKKPVAQRQELLRAWLGSNCQCTRCKREEQEELAEDPNYV